MRLTKLIAGGLIAASALSASLAQAQDKLRIGLVPFSEALAAVVADKLGYFKAENISVEFSKFAGSALALPLVHQGKLDIALSNTVSTLQAVEQGMDLAVLAPGAVVRTKAPDSTLALMALKTTIKSPKDLEGKRIAVNVINSSAWLYVVAYLDKVGVDRSKVRFVEIPFPQMNDPLLNGQVDAIGQVEPFSTILIDSGKADRMAFPYVETQPNGEITQYVATTDWVKKDPQLMQRFVRAIRKAAEYLNNPANEAAIRDVNIAYTGLNPAMKDRVTLPRFGIQVDEAELARTRDMMLKYGLLKKPVDLSGRVVTVK